MKSGVLCPRTKIRTSKYLNDIIEQDHRRVKQRLYPMLGFRCFGNVAVPISGIELAQKIRKRQFNTSDVIAMDGARVSQMWMQCLPDEIKHVR